MSDAGPLNGRPPFTAGGLSGPAGVHTGRILAGRYRLKRLIAKGGMAEVWEALDDILGRPVAVKILLAHLAADDSFRERFRREAIAAARLAHPNVVATYDTGTDSGITFIVMELVEARTLRELLNEEGPLVPGRAVHIAAQVADALHYAHRAGVVHRDVKPANILVGPDGRLKVADFGIAKAVEESEPDRPSPAESLTMTGSIVGTAQYLSPEQVDGRAVDGRTDVYALGVVLYEMVTGRPPFSGETEMAVALKHVTTEPPSPRRLKGDIPPPLEAIVLRAMAKAPEARYQSAAEFRTALLTVDLSEVDATNVVRAGPRTTVGPAPRDLLGARPPPPARPADTARRSPPPPAAPPPRRWVVPTVAIVAVALTLGVVGVLFAQSDVGHKLLDSGSSAAEPATGQQALPTPTPLAFDPPPGSGSEHDDQLPNLVDKDPSTVWTTEQYGSNKFGGLKQGVGVVLQLDGPHTLKDLKVTSSSTGWTAEVLVADAAKAARAAWGDPVDSKKGINGGSTTFDLHGRTGGAVLLWITDLGDATSVSIAELRLEG